MRTTGPSYARNIGLSAAVGEWIQFMDSDDMLEADMLKKMFTLSLNNEWDMIVYGFYRQLPDGGREVCSLKSHNLRNVKDIQDFFLKMDTKSKSIFMNYLWNRWIKRSVLTENNITFDQSLRLGEDFVFISQALKNMNSVLILAEPLYYYCNENMDSLSKQFDPNEFYRRKVMYTAFCDCMEAFEILEKMKEFIDYNEGLYAVNAISKINNRTCTLNNQEKVSYVKTLITGKLRKCEVTYLRNQKGLKFLVKLLLIKSGSPNLIVLFWKSHI